MSFTEETPWIWIALAVAALLPMAWLAWRQRLETNNRHRTLGLLCRGLGIALIAFALANPQRVSERPASGANAVALLADNSMGLRIKEPGSSFDRAESIRQALNGEDSQWLADLAAEYQVRNYSFGTSIQRIASFENLDFTSEQSNIYAALNETRQRLSKIPLAAIVLLTDGVATDREPSLQELADLPPVFPVVVGSRSETPDLAVANLSLSQSTFGDSPIQLETNLQQVGLPAKQVRATVRRLTTPGPGAVSFTERTISEKTLTIDRGADVSFEWIPKEGGIQFYEFSAERVENPDTENEPEATLANNKRRFVADRGKDVYRILYLTGRPNWEYKFLNRALSQDPQVNMVGLIRVATQEPKFQFRGRAGESSNTLYRGFGREDENERYDEAVLIRMNTRDAQELRAGFPNDAESLYAYDAIIIDDLEADFFSYNQQTLVRDFVKQRGGGLLILGGVNSLEDGGYENTPISEALPLYIDRASKAATADRAVQWELTREGWVEPWTRIRPLESEERARLRDMPLLQVYNTLRRIKPGANTLATITDATADTYPALVTRNYGAGRVATLAVGDLWRWGMQDAGSQADLAQFWRQISRWLVKDNPRQVELLSRQTESGGITLTAIARDAQYRPLTAGSAKVFVSQLTAGDEAVDQSIDLELSMKPVSGKPGQFSLELPLDDDGAFHARVDVTNQDGVVVGEAETGWVNQPLVAEFASLSPDRDYLNRIAEGTGGRVLELSELDSLVATLESRPAPVMEIWSEPAWHSNWLFLLALTCFLAEWLLRRKRGLA